MCSHQRDYKRLKYFSKDGIPMSDFECLHCGFKDIGHIHWGEKNWESSFEVVENGKKIDCDSSSNSTIK